MRFCCRQNLLFETEIPTRYYLPEANVETQFLSQTNSETISPYKGFASSYNVTVNGETYEDIVWTYPDPIPEIPKIKGLLAFWPEKGSRIQIKVVGG